MATRTVTEFLDDTDGTPADETVAFAVDGVQYEIDLSADNAAALRDVLAPYQSAARRIGGRRSTTRPTAAAAQLDLKAVRAWAADNGIDLNSRGRVPGHVIEQFHAAGH